MTPIDRSALVLIELQNEWLDPAGKINGLMQDRQQFEDAIGGARRALAAARTGGLDVVHCGLRFQAGHPELANGQAGLREAIPRFGTFPVDRHGSQFHADFAPEPGEFVVQGRTGSSGFCGSNLDNYLRNNDINTIYLAGFALHVCVESTLRDGHDRGYHVTVLEDATAAFTPEQRQHVLEHVIHHFARRATVDEFAERIGAVVRR